MTAALEQRLREAVDAAVFVAAGDERTLQQRTADAIVAAAQVLVDELGPRPAVPSPGVRTDPYDLPDEPGSVVLATEVRAVRLDPPMPMLLDDAGEWNGAGKVTLTTGHERWSHRYDDITRWIPARVVRDDQYGPAAALQQIVRLLDEQAGGWAHAIHAARETAVAALQPLDGGEPS